MPPFDKEPVPFEFDISVKGFAISPDGSVLAIGSDESNVEIWNIEQNTRVKRLIIDQKWRCDVLTVAFSPDGSKLAALIQYAPAPTHIDLVVWDSKDFTEIGRTTIHPGYVSAFTFLPDSQHIATGGSDGIVKLWHIDDEKKKD
jgi:WD40 repeat protein